jgi:PAS domain S-box-containing protein
MNDARNHLDPILDEQRRLFASFMEHLPGSAWIKDVDGRYVYANRTAQRKWGKVLRELLGKVDAEVFPPNTAKLFTENDRLAISMGKGLRTIETLDDGLHSELVQKFPIFNQQGEPTWVGGIAVDVSELKQAEEVLQKTLNETEQLKERLLSEHAYLREEIHTQHNFEEMIGESPAFKRSVQDLGRVAASDVSVLIVGETGTGKELLARAVHSRSRRKERPLIKLNCGSMAPGLVESELFGHERGAFTGATQRRIGRFELADKGTLFLDEVGELTPDTQVKLLRVLQEGEFERVGSNTTRTVDVRLIAATNRDLQEAVRAGSFRPDLFYRLNVFPLEAPPLRERRSDIPLLTRFFLAKVAKKLGKPSLDVSAATLERMGQYAWPGNIRELQNILERAAVLAQGETIEVDDSILGHGPSAPRSDKLEDVERGHILGVLTRTGWRIDGERGAAEVLGMNPSTLRSRIKGLGISRPARR